MVNDHLNDLRHEYLGCGLSQQQAISQIRYKFRGGSGPSEKFGLQNSVLPKLEFLLQTGDRASYQGEVKNTQRETLSNLNKHVKAAPSPTPDFHSQFAQHMKSLPGISQPTATPLAVGKGKKILAWDLCRYVYLVRMSYAAGTTKIACILFLK